MRCKHQRRGAFEIAAIDFGLRQNQDLRELKTRSRLVKRMKQHA